MVEHLLDRSITLAISNERLEDEMIVYQEVGRKVYVAALHRDHPMVRQGSVSLADLKNETFICDNTRLNLEVLRREGWNVRKASNDVLSGIRLTADALKNGKIVICDPCADAIREFGSYCWDLSAGDRDKVKKQFDHAMDEIRYFVATVAAPEEAGDRFWAGFVERRV